MKKIIPRSGVGQFIFFWAQTFVSYLIITANFRAIAEGLYAATAVTDFLLTAVNVIIAKLAIEDKDGRSWAAIWGACFGGTCGSLLSIWITKHIFK